MSYKAPIQDAYPLLAYARAAADIYYRRLAVWVSSAFSGCTTASLAACSTSTYGATTAATAVHVLFCLSSLIIFAY